MTRLLVCLVLLAACGEPARSQQGGDKPGTPASAEAKAGGAQAKPSGGDHPALLKPALANAQAPARYAVKLATTKGDIVIDVDRSWAPLGADRFYNLVKIGYFNHSAFFRVISGFMAQVGLSGRPKVDAVWRRAPIKDDPVTQQNQRGMVTFATSGRDSRVNQFYINLADNSRLDSMGFAPFGKVRDMAVVDTLYAGYGEGAPSGRGPAQHLINARGNAYLEAEFPELDYIESATLVDPQ